MTSSIQQTAHRIFDELEKSVIGKRDVIQDVFCAFLAKGHVLLEDNPGLAKTVLANSFSQVLGGDFRRIQFTPDLMPNDISGGYVFNRQTSEFQLQKGPVFTNILLADEINRATPKTQAALLEAMAEKQVTLEGHTERLPAPFWVIATQNPIDYESTFPLPEAQLDRFLIRLSMGYPSYEDEVKIIQARNARKTDSVVLEQVVTISEALQMQAAIEEIHVSEEIMAYLVSIVRATREHPQFVAGASLRASLALMNLAKARAAVEGRDFVTPDDIKHFAYASLGHRVVAKPELWLSGAEICQQIHDIVEQIAVPVLD